MSESKLVQVKRNDGAEPLVRLDRVYFAEVVTKRPGPRGVPMLLQHPQLVLLIDGCPAPFAVHRDDERRVWKHLTDQPYPIPTNGQVKIAE